MPTMPEPLIIFDCDGVLVDSEPISNRILADLLTEIGLPTTFSQSLQMFLGRSWEDNLKVIERRLGKEPPDNLYATYTERLFQAFESELNPINGIEFVLDQLPFPMCVASSGPHDKIQKTLSLTGLLRFFEGNIFSSSDVKKGKPAPDLFLYACERMGSTPDSSIVIEDALPGVKAAVSAGMSVLGYAPNNNGSSLRNNGASTFSDMRELPELLSCAIEARPYGVKNEL